MDYLFVIKKNGQAANLNELKLTIIGFGQPTPYLEIDELEKGLIGIVRFAAGETDVQRAVYFDKLRGLVAGINGLNSAQVDSRTLQSGPTTPATWARASLADVLVGFGVEGTANLNSDINSYQIISTLKGGIGGKH